MNYYELPICLVKPFQIILGTMTSAADDLSGLRQYKWKKRVIVTFVQSESDEQLQSLKDRIAARSGQ